MLLFGTIVVVAGIYGLVTAKMKFDEKYYPKKIFQAAKDNFERVNKKFYKYFVPCIYDMRALHEAYEKGLSKLNETELNYYFSYPKTYELDDYDNLIVNNVNLGPAKKCCLLQIMYQVPGYDVQTNYGDRYRLLKNHNNGRMMIEKYLYGLEVTSLMTKDELKEYAKEGTLSSATDKIINFTDSEIDKIVGSSESAFKKFSYVLPPKYMDLYNDFQKNDYTSAEMSEKMNELYKDGQNAYMKFNENYAKNKALKDKDLKERVGKFWNYTCEAGRQMSKENYKEFDNERETHGWGSGYRDLGLREKYNQNYIKEIEEEYELQ